MFNLDKLIHHDIHSLKPYQAGKSIEQLQQEYGINDVIKLASNENPLGASPKAHHAIQALSAITVSLYPTKTYHPLKQKIASKLNIPVDWVTLGAGSDALFSYILYAFAEGQNKIMLTHQYAFITYKILAHMHHVETIESPVNANFEVNIEALVNKVTPETGVIFLANPNNPTGIPLSKDNIEYLLTHTPKNTIIVIDEAYDPYSNTAKSCKLINTLPNHPNLIITRTFSKIYGLAGLRLGYAISNPDIASILDKVQLPFTINQIALEAGLHALDDDAFIEETLTINEQGKAQLLEGLLSLPIQVYPSEGNFLLINCQKDAIPLFHQLEKKGIIVRPLVPYGLQTCLRVSIGTKEQNERFLTVFKTLF
jgi:histidinol-phosphate aminotransferase